MTGLFWAVAAAALALDVGSKLWAVRSLEQAVTVLPGVLELRLSRNNGMALGLLSGNWLANLLLPLAVIVAGWLWKTNTKAFPMRSCSGRPPF